MHVTRSPARRKEHGLSRLRTEQRGLAMMEYAVLLVVILAACLVAWRQLGDSLGCRLQAAVAAVASVDGRQGASPRRCVASRASRMAGATTLGRERVGGELLAGDDGDARVERPASTAEANAQSGSSGGSRSVGAMANNEAPPIPKRAADTMIHVRKTGEAPPGHVGGRIFRNDGRSGGRVLPQHAVDGSPIVYREFVTVQG